MRNGVKEVSSGRLRETHGRYFEEFVVRHIHEHKPRPTITDADNAWFKLLTMNTRPVHFDYEFSKKIGERLPNRASPKLGADSDAVHDQAGFTAVEIAGLRVSGTI